MKRDWKLYSAVLILIALVIVLIFISLDRSQKLDQAIQTINRIQAQVPPTPTVINGKTPVLGIDYFNGQNGPKGQDGKNGVDGTNGKDGATGPSAFDVAVKNGFVGTEQQWLESLRVKGDKGDPAPELEIECIDGRIVKKYSVYTFWQMTKIKCEVDDE